MRRRSSFARSLDEVFVHDGLLSDSVRHAMNTAEGAKIAPYFDLRAFTATELPGFYLAGSLGAVRYELDEAPSEWEFLVNGVELDFRLPGCRRPEDFGDMPQTVKVPPAMEAVEPQGSPTA